MTLTDAGKVLAFLRGTTVVSRPTSPSAAFAMCIHQ